MTAMQTPITNFLDVTLDDLEAYKLALYQPFDINNYKNIPGSPTTSLPTSITPNATGVVTCSKSSKAVLMKGIKHDITSFPLLKSEEHWDS